MLRWLQALLFLTVATAACAQSSSLVPYTGSSAVLPGTYTVATLPGAASNQGRYAFVTDLGGGADMVLSDGANWKHIRMGTVTLVAVAGSSVVITPLSSPPIMQLTSSAPLTITSTLNIMTMNLYSGYSLHIIVPTGVLGAAGALGVSVSGANSLPLVGGTWEDVQWNGSTLVETAKGTL